eukprot:jgi/Tetstr1/448975/TSEL_036200.t1
MATLRADDHTPQTRADADYRLDSALRARSRDRVVAAGEDRLAYIKRFMGKKALTGDKKVAERLVYMRFFGTAVADRGANGADGLVAALDDKPRGQPPPFRQGSGHTCLQCQRRRRG